MEENKKPENPNAFPYVETYIQNGAGAIKAYNAKEGMSLRDYFAAKAMQAHILGANENSRAITSEMRRREMNAQTLIAKMAYEYADAMLKEREKQSL